MRVIQWITQRCANTVGANETPIGFLPHVADIDSRGVDIKPGALDALLKVDAGQWKAEMASVEDYLKEFGERLPAELLDEHRRVVKDLG